MSEASAPGHEPWRRTGRCGSCTYFVVDFGAGEDTLGHCKMKQRRAAVTVQDWACPEYRPLAGFEQLTRSTDPNALRAPAPGGSPAREAPRAPRRAPRGPVRAAVVRRRGGQERAVGEVTGIVLPDDVRAFFGEGGEAMDTEAVRDVLLDIIEQFIGLEDVELGERWAGGTLVLQPANPESKPTEIPIETFFHKIVMLRDRLRVLEAKLNAHDGLSDADKVELQQYVSRCYGTLTTFNVLFKHGEDRFSSK